MIQFTQPIHATPIGDAILLPPLSTPYEPCSRCSGYGLVDGMAGPRDCPECRGDTVVRARDARGRFATITVRPYTPTVGVEAEVVEPAPGFMSFPERNPPIFVWRRVGFVKVVEVLPIYDHHTVTDEGLPVDWLPHVTVDDSGNVLICRRDERYTDEWSETSVDLPTAEPGGLAVLVQRLECPDCLGRGWDLVRPIPGVADDLTSCPTCTTPPEVTT